MKLPRLFRNKHKKDHQKPNLVVGTGGKTNYRILPNLRFAYAMPLVLLFAGIGTYMVFGGKAASTDTANIWVVSSGAGSCKRVDNQTNLATASSASNNVTCSSFQAAYTASIGGDTVLVANGSYTSSKLSVSGGTKSPATIISVESGGKVTCASCSEVTYRGLDGLIIDGTKGVNGQGIDIQSVGNALGLNYDNTVALRNFTFKGFKIHDNVLSGNDGNQIWGGTNCFNVTVAYGELSNVLRADGIQMGPTTKAGGCDGVTFDHLFLHDFSASAGDHQDGIQVRGGSNITFSNSRITNMTCSACSQGIFMNPADDLGGDYMTITGNVISNISGEVINLCSQHAELTYNTFAGKLNTDPSSVCGTPTHVTTVGNLLDAPCTGKGGLNDFQKEGSAATYGYNVNTTSCGHESQGDSLCSSWSNAFVGPLTGPAAAQNFSLKSGSCAIDKGSKSDYPATDILGNTRYAGSAPDAGAYEYGAVSASTPTANLWIDNSGTGSCTRSPSPITYAQATTSPSKACSRVEVPNPNNQPNQAPLPPTTYGQMEQALSKCVEGDAIGMVGISGGSYGSETILSEKTGVGCTIAGDTTTPVKVASIYLRGSHVTINDVHVNGSVGFEDIGKDSSGTPLPNNITLNRVDMVGPTFWDGGSKITWNGGKIGPGKFQCIPAGSAICNGDGWIVLQGDPNPLDTVTLNGITFDDIKIDNSCLVSPQGPHPGTDPCHVEIIRLEDGSSNVTIKNSAFTNINVNTGTIFTGSKGGGSVNGLTLENNFFGDSGASAVKPGNGCRNLKINSNTFIGSLTLANCIQSTTNVSVVGNLGNGACSAPAGTVNFSYNVWVGDACATKGVTTDIGGQSITYIGDGFHIPSNSPAKDFVPLVNCFVSTDHDGDPRPQGAGCDAGADEFVVAGGSTDTTKPTVSITSPTTGATISGTVNITANASDNVAVTKVEFYDGTTLLGSDTTSPYSYSWVTTGSGSHSLTAKAYDTVPANTTTSSAITVNVSNTTGTTCSTKPGNANTDSVVNIQDIATVLSNYGKTVPTGTTNCADVNNDKIINIQDIAYILGRYGT